MTMERNLYIGIDLHIRGEDSNIWAIMVRDKDTGKTLATFKTVEELNVFIDKQKESKKGMVPLND